jgi:hypothetical protein
LYLPEPSAFMTPTWSVHVLEEKTILEKTIFLPSEDRLTLSHVSGDPTGVTPVLLIKLIW